MFKSHCKQTKMDQSDDEMEFIEEPNEETKDSGSIKDERQIKPEEQLPSYVPPKYEKTPRMCQECSSTNKNLPPDNEEEKKNYDLYLPYFFCPCKDVLVCTLCAMENHQDHSVISLKMVIGYCDSLFNESRSFVTDPNVYKIIPEDLMTKYSDLENQYAYVERKFLNFHNIMILKRYIENVTKEVTNLCTQYIQDCPQNLTENSYKSVAKIEDEMQPCKKLTADGEELNIVISEKKEVLDCEFSVLEVDPSQEKDRIIMEDLRGYKLVKVSKLIMIYDKNHLEDIHKFFNSIHHVSEFILKSRNPSSPIPLDPSTLPIVTKIYSCTYEHYEITGITLSEADMTSLGHAFHKNRNNLTINFTHCSLTSTLLAHYFSPLLTTPRILFLQYLSLPHNNISNTGVSILALTLPYLEYLNVLNLAHNQISDSGAKSLSKTFKYLPRAVQILLSNNKVTKKGLKAFLEHFHYLRSLARFDLSGNLLGEEGVCMAVRRLAGVKKEFVFVVKENGVREMERVREVIEEEEMRSVRVRGSCVVVE
ncbi:unnamed protein product [Moneuplotes crassus]|uniref:Uncharacterized protein n=1 Tax=Euplotes crassus TaxID=5936 RepID=A0AAD1Y4E6_EUPCR|nr:unnamed protein product [Moneuplotes crassus]